MNDTYQNDDGTQASYEARRPRGPVADPHVAARMELLADALGGDIGAAEEREVNWDGDDELAAAFNSIKAALEKSKTPDRPTDDVPNSYWTAPEGS